MFVFTILAGLLASVAGHGMMVVPVSRNVLSNAEYCPHCMNAGGPWLVYGNTRAWPNGKYGLCGDPYDSPRPHEGGGKHATNRIAKVYKRGATITIAIKLTAAHGGLFEFKVCPVPRGVSGIKERRFVTQRCFNAHPLRTTSGSRFWWLGKRGPGLYIMRFTLPKDVRCERCVLQWHYLTGNSCSIPGTPRGYEVGINMCKCGRNCAFPEEFWNCADVRIV